LGDRLLKFFLFVIVDAASIVGFSPTQVDLDCVSVNLVL